MILSLSESKTIEGVVESGTTKLGKVIEKLSIFFIESADIHFFFQFPVKTKDGKIISVARTSLEIDRKAADKQKASISNSHHFTRCRQYVVYAQESLAIETRTFG